MIVRNNTTRVTLFSAIVLIAFSITPPEARAWGWGQTIGIAAGGVIVEFAKGVAHSFGEATGEKLGQIVYQYPPPDRGQQSLTYHGQQGGDLTYNFIGYREGQPVYRAEMSDAFLRNLREFDEKMDQLDEQMLRDGLIEPYQYEELRRNNLRYRGY